MIHPDEWSPISLDEKNNFIKIQKDQISELVDTLKTETTNFNDIEHVNGS